MKISLLPRETAYNNIWCVLKLIEKNLFLQNLVYKVYQKKIISKGFIVYWSAEEFYTILLKYDNAQI